jgi:hypothetical protein
MEAQESLFASMFCELCDYFVDCIASTNCLILNGRSISIEIPVNLIQLPLSVWSIVIMQAQITMASSGLATFESIAHEICPYLKYWAKDLALEIDFAFIGMPYFLDCSRM